MAGGLAEARGCGRAVMGVSWCERTAGEWKVWLLGWWVEGCGRVTGRKGVTKKQLEL